MLPPSTAACAGCVASASPCERFRGSLCKSIGEILHINHTLSTGCVQCHLCLTGSVLNAGASQAVPQTVGRDPELDRQIGDLTVALRSVLDLYRRTQDILFAHLPPGGPDEKTTINNLLALLDGCEQRAIRRAADAALLVSRDDAPCIAP